MLVAAEKLHARDAMAIGLIDAIADDPVAEAVRQIRNNEDVVSTAHPVMES